MSQSQPPARWSIFCLLAFSLAAYWQPLTAQVDYELTYTEIRQHSTLVAGLAEGDSLSSLERTLALTPSDDTLLVRTGYRRVEGLYDEVEVLNPDRPEREPWQGPLPTHQRIDAEGVTVRDQAGHVVLQQPPSERDRLERRELEALAASGRLTPFVRAIIPTAAELEALRREGYLVEVQELAVVGRGTGSGARDVGFGPTVTLLRDGLTGDSRVLTAERPGERIVADARSASITTYTYADEANTLLVAAQASYLLPAEPLGGEGHYEALCVDVIVDTLATGRAVQRVQTSRKSEYRYAGPGAGNGAPDSAAEQPFGSIVNPLAEGEMIVAIPEDFRRSATLTLVDVEGRVHTQRPIAAGDGPLIRLPLPANLPAGTYVLVADNGSARRQQLVLIQ